MRTKERRKAVRAPATLAMEIKLSGKDCGRLETINVSANGVYFSSPEFIAPLTRLEITLVLPENTETPAAAKREVACEGVVVRTEPEREETDRDRYDVACYFTSITESDREHLESYILSQLAF
ncbi:MAG: PilZ domain-containing protein [Candidatus Latescibacterota bacterium]|nr:MAG: PilZ domain-containing protein [Candidatus Latescibacterota bacterium]